MLRSSDWKSLVGCILRSNNIIVTTAIREINQNKIIYNNVSSLGFFFSRFSGRARLRKDEGKRKRPTGTGHANDMTTPDGLRCKCNSNGARGRRFPGTSAALTFFRRVAKDARAWSRIQPPDIPTTTAHASQGYDVHAEPVVVVFTGETRPKPSTVFVNFCYRGPWWVPITDTYCRWSTYREDTTVGLPYNSYTLYKYLLKPCSRERVKRWSLIGQFMLQTDTRNRYKGGEAMGAEAPLISFIDQPIPQVKLKWSNPIGVWLQCFRIPHVKNNNNQYQT